MIIADRFAFDLAKKSQKLGQGAVGEVIRGTDQETGKDVAIKLEAADSKHPQILHEAKIYRALEDGIGVPCVYWVG